MRAGEVIPEIVSVISELRDGTEEVVNPPSICPICSTKLEQDEGKVAIYCPNSYCPAKIQGQFEMFVGKQGLNIDGLGIKQIELFLELGWISDFVSLFHLASHKTELLQIEGYKEKSVNNLLEAIEKARHTTLDRVFVALGIPNVGKKTGKILAEYIFLEKNNEESIMQVLLRLNNEALETIHDIGLETATSIIEYIEKNGVLIERLLDELSIFIPERKEKML